MDVSGYWNSVLTYGQGYGLLVGKTLNCELQLQQVGVAFMGSSQDIEGEGCHGEEAVITGRISQEGKIVYTKNYPCLHSVNRNGELILYPKIAGPDIHFEGHYKEDKDQFEGVWTVRVKVYFLGLIPRTVQSKGNWTMKRVL